MRKVRIGLGFLHIPTDKYFPHEGGSWRYHNIPNQLPSQVSGNSHTHTTEEAYCPYRQLRQLEAATDGTKSDLKRIIMSEK